MKDMFPEYYTPSDDEFADLWRDAIFVFDANVLLNIYRFSPKTSQELIKIIEGFNDRVWIPYQFADEYHKHKLKNQYVPPSSYDDLKRWLEKTIKGLQEEVKSQLGAFHNRTLIQVEANELTESLDNLSKIFDQLLKQTTALQTEHQEWLDKSDLSDKIANLFTNKVGLPYSEEELFKKVELAKIRYEKKIPPGFADKKDYPYGDFIGWSQMIDHAKEVKKPIIFVTADVKPDWFFHINNQPKVPLPELIREMRDEVGVSFYLYPTAIFLSRAREYLNTKVSDETIAEVEAVEENKQGYILSNSDLRNLNGVAKSAIEAARYFEREIDTRRAMVDMARTASEAARYFEREIDTRRAMVDMARTASEAARYHERAYPTHLELGNFNNQQAELATDMALAGDVNKKLIADEVSSPTDSEVGDFNVSQSE